MTSAAQPRSQTLPLLRRLNPIRLTMALFAWAADWIARFFAPAPPRLGEYHRARAPLRDKMVKRTIYSLIIFTGLIYGFMVAIFPMAFYLYMGVPLAIMALMIVWALPERETVPERQMEWLFWAFFISLFMWPNYLAIALPGLPWITAQRLFTAPLVLLMLVSLSTSPPFRERIKSVLRDSPWITRLLLAFVAIQTVTLIFSKHPGDAINRYLSNQMEWTAIFFVSCFVFMKEGRAEKWARLLILMAIALSVVALFEQRKQAVLWAGHIPAFLAVADENVQRILAGGARFATGLYRLQATFSTSLNFAEFLGLTTAFVIHAIVTAPKTWQKSLLMAYIPLHFWIIWGTDSRLGMIGFYGSFLLYLLVWSVKRWVSNRNDLIAPALVLAYPVFLAIFYTASLFWQKLNRMIWGGGPQQASNESRKQQWSMLWPKLERWPFGHGVTSSGDILGFTNGAGVITVDSYYITVLIDFGVLGFFAFFGMILTGALQAYIGGYRARETEAQLLLPTAVVLVLFVVIKGVLSQDDNHAIIYMLLGMVAAFTHRARVRQREAKAVASSAANA